MGETRSRTKSLCPFQSPKSRMNKMPDMPKITLPNLKKLLENFNVASFFSHALNLEDKDAANIELHIIHC
jgi:hypothetical protein